MKSHIIEKILICLFISFTYLLYGKDLQFEHLMIEDGLSQSTVFDIIQDSEGFLWFATQDGLNRYDGYSFKIYYSDANITNSITDNNIQVIREDSFGNLWIGTAGGGLNKFNRKAGAFTVYKYDQNDPSSIRSNHVTSILIDNNGIIWIGTLGGGLNKLDPYTEEFS